MSTKDTWYEQSNILNYFSLIFFFTHNEKEMNDNFVEIDRKYQSL